MANVSRFLKVLDRATQDGPLCKKKEWDRVIMSKVPEKLKEQRDVHKMTKKYGGY